MFTGDVENIGSTGYNMFDVGAFRFKAHPKQTVLRMAPYIRTNEDDEESASAMLLLYVPWPAEGEQNLLRGSESAVCAFKALKCAGKLPIHVLHQIEISKKSEEVVNDIGDVVFNNRIEGSDDSEHEEGAERSDDRDEGSNDGEFGDDDGCDVDDLENAMEGIAVEEDETEDIDKNDELEANESVRHRCSTGVQIITEHQCAYFKQFIKTRITAHLNQYMEENTITCVSGIDSGNQASSSNSMSGKVPVNNEAERQAVLNTKLDRLTVDQAGAITAIRPSITDKAPSQIQYVSGGAGVGKSEYIKCATEITRIFHGKQPGRYGSVLILAPTGCSARNVGGYTWQSALGRGRNEKAKKDQYAFLNQQKAQEVYNNIRGVKLIVIDGIFESTSRNISSHM